LVRINYLDLLRPDKIVHAVVFAIFFFLLVKGFRKKGNPPTIIRFPILIAFLVGVAVAAGTEVLQELAIPNRIGSVWDFTANMVGCFVGWIGIRAVKYIRPMEHR